MEKWLQRNSRRNEHEFAPGSKCIGTDKSDLTRNLATPYEAKIAVVIHLMLFSLPIRTSKSELDKNLYKT